ncbi:GTPase-associated system all-helical protein GASH [uncultured Sphingomonas sp.]|uniref:GTPase-associated system all-helical protein GASH n=1 Tax=uncultured Sphingomonas sp. TaxID=158754 RepID=UPI0025912826|nr:GTPase-associated system all-helical protein GASH [uncultured Sphingomonas sp.]
MGDGVLQGFLNRGLIDVGGDDAKLDKLLQAAGDLAAALKKNPSKALAFSLIAFDPSAPEADPVVQEALAALQNRWTTYRNTFSATPVAVIRAMLLDALVAGAAEDDQAGDHRPRCIVPDPASGRSREDRTSERLSGNGRFVPNFALSIKSGVGLRTRSRP